nr:hypothetical protein [Tanacetum cinerariifolium]
MIAFLEKSNHNVDFHRIVDFVEASYIRIETIDEGTKILATVDGKPKTISKSSIRRNLKLNDEEGISSLPDADLFENLALMGYHILSNQKFTFQKGQFFHQWKYLIHTIMQCLSPESTGFNEFSRNIATVVVCLATNRVYNFLKMIFDGMVRNVNNKGSKFLIRARIAQSKALPTAADEHASLSRDDSQGEAFPTVFGLKAGHDKENIIKTYALPHDSTPRVTSLAADEGIMQHQLQELTNLYTRLQRQRTEMDLKINAQDLEIPNLKARIKLLEDKDGGGAEPSGEDATIKERSLETGEEAGLEKSTERGSNDTEELVNVLTSLDAANILTSGVQVVSVPPTAEVSIVSVPTCSGLVPTASPIFTTASVVTPYLKREGSRTPTEPHHTPSPKAQQSPQHDLSSSILPLVTTATIPIVIPTEIPTLRQYSRRARIKQDRTGDRANIIKTSTLPHDSTPRVTSFAAFKGSMQHQLTELMDLCTRLQRKQTDMANKIAAQDLEIANLKARIKMLEDKDAEGAEPSGEDAIIKGRSLETEEKASVERSTERGSNDTEEQVNVLTSLDPASILTYGVQVVSVPLAAEVTTVRVPTGSGMVPTVSPIFATASIVTPYAIRKGKEKMVDSDTPKKKKLQEHIARDAKIARIHAEEELQMLIDGLDRNNKTIAKCLQEYEQFTADLFIAKKIDMINELVKYQDHYAKVLKYQAQQNKPLSKKQQREFYMPVLKSHSGWKTKHFKGMTLEKIREKFIPVWKKIEDFVPMASKEERERVKRKGLRLEQDSTKKMKIAEDVSVEDLKVMMQLMLVEEVYVEALQHFDREDLTQLWTLVRETLSIRQATSDKKKELWVELKRLYEPDVEDQLWTYTQALMHDPVEWRLYDTCGVHHVLSRD